MTKRSHDASFMPRAISEATTFLRVTTMGGARIGGPRRFAAPISTIKGRARSLGFMNVRSTDGKIVLVASALSARLTRDLIRAYGVERKLQIVSIEAIGEGEWNEDSDD